MSDEIENKIIKLKAEVYDIIRQQEQLASNNGVLQDKKIRLSQEIQSLEVQLLEPEVVKP